VSVDTPTHTTRPYWLADRPASGLDEVPADLFFTLFVASVYRPVVSDDVRVVYPVMLPVRMTPEGEEALDLHSRTGPWLGYRREYPHPPVTADLAVSVRTHRELPDAPSEIFPDSVPRPYMVRRCRFVPRHLRKDERYYISEGWKLCWAESAAVIFNRSAYPQGRYEVRALFVGGERGMMQVTYPDGPTWQRPAVRFLPLQGSVLDYLNSFVESPFPYAQAFR